MEYTILIACCLATVALARPDLYKENENFQYSRSSPDEGQKSGFYAAQRGNMGGNYEKARNMDGQANRQMSDLVHQVGTQLGVDPALLHGDGSRLNTHGNLYGSATASGTTYGQSSLADQRTGQFQTSAHNIDASSLQHKTHTDYSQEGTSQQTLGATYDGYGTNNNYAGSSERQHDSMEGRRENVRTGSSYDSAYKASSSGSSYKSSVDSQRELDSSYQMGSGLQGTHQQSIVRPVNVYPKTTLRLAVRPHQVSQLNIPVTAQNRESYRGSQSVYSSNADRMNENTFPTVGESQVEIVENNRQIDSSNVQKHNTAYNYGHTTHADNDNTYSTHDEREDNLHRGTSDNANNYESQYSYRKEWEKHSVTPVAVRPVYVRPATAIPLAVSYVPVRPHATTYVGNINQGAADDSQSQTQSDYHRRQNAQESRYSADSIYNSNAAASQVSNVGSARTSDSGRYADIHSAQNVGNGNIGVVTSAPKSYQSAYSYHKSWERQGTPYIITPADSNVNIGLDESKDLQSGSSLDGYNRQRASSSYSAENSESQRSSAMTRQHSNFQHNMNNMHSGLNEQLTDSMDNLCNSNCGSGSSAKGFKATYSYNAQRSYGAGEADDNGHYRHVRSTGDRPKRYSYHNERGDIGADFGEVEDVGQQLEDVGQQVEDLGQHTKGFDYADEDVGQQVELHTPTTLGQQLVDSDYQKLLEQNAQHGTSHHSAYSHSYQNSDISGSGPPSLAPGHTHEFHYGNSGYQKISHQNQQGSPSQHSAHSHSYQNLDISGSGPSSLAPGHTHEFHYGNSGYQKLPNQNQQGSPSQHSALSHSYHNSDISVSGQPAIAPGHTHEFHYGNSGYQKLLNQNQQGSPSQNRAHSHSYHNSDISVSGQPAIAPGHTHEFNYGNLHLTIPEEENRQKDGSHQSSYSHSYSSSSGTAGKRLEKHTDESVGLYGTIGGKQLDIQNIDSSKVELETPHYGSREYYQYPDQVMHASHSTSPISHDYHKSSPTFQGYGSSYSNIQKHQSSYPTTHTYSTQHNWSQNSDDGTVFHEGFDKIMKELEETAKSTETNKSSVALTTQSTQQSTSITSLNNLYTQSSFEPHVTSNVGYQYPTGPYNTVTSINANLPSTTYDNNDQSEVNITDYSDGDKYKSTVEQSYGKPTATQGIDQKHDVYYSHREKTPSEIESLSLVGTNDGRVNRTAETEDQTLTNKHDISLTLQPPHYPANEHLSSNNHQNSAKVDNHWNGIAISQNDGSVFSQNSDVDIQIQNEKKTEASIDWEGAIDTIDKEKYKPGAGLQTAYGSNANTFSSHSNTTYGYSTGSGPVLYTTEKHGQAKYSTQDIETLSHTSREGSKNYGQSTKNEQYLYENNKESNSHSTLSHQDKTIEGLDQTYVNGTKYGDKNDGEIQTLSVSSPLDISQKKVETNLHKKDTAESNLLSQSTSNYHGSQSNKELQSFSTGYQKNNGEGIDQQTLLITSANYEGHNKLNAKPNIPNDNDRHIENVDPPIYNAQPYPSRDYNHQKIEQMGQTALNVNNQKSSQENVNGAAHTQEHKYNSEILTENQESFENGQQAEDFGQQIVNLDQQEDWGQQSENWDQTVDWENPQDLGQQVEDIGQQSEGMGQQVEDIGQLSQDLGQEVEDIGQLSQDLGQEVEDIGQKSQDLGQQVEDLEQQVEEVGQLEVSAQYGDSSSVQSNYKSHPKEDMDQKPKPDEEIPEDGNSTTKPSFWKRAKNKASSWFG